MGGLKLARTHDLQNGLFWPVSNSHFMVSLKLSHTFKFSASFSFVSSQNQRKFPLLFLPSFVPRKPLQHARPCWTACNLKCCYPYRYQVIKVAHCQILCLEQSCLLLTKSLCPSTFWRPGADPHPASAVQVLVPLFGGRPWRHPRHTSPLPSLFEQYFNILAKRITTASLCHASRKASKTFSQLTQQLSYCTSSDLGTERGNGKKTEL